MRILPESGAFYGVCGQNTPVHIFAFVRFATSAHPVGLVFYDA
jgi:hypothetical protein